MKRSELAKIIEQYFTEADVSDIVENADYHSRILLALIEDAGMLPPTTTLNKLGVIDNAWEEE